MIMRINQSFKLNAVKIIFYNQMVDKNGNKLLNQPLSYTVMDRIMVKQLFTSLRKIQAFFKFSKKGRLLTNYKE